MEYNIPPHISGIWAIDVLARTIPEEFWTYSDIPYCPEPKAEDVEIMAALRSDVLYEIRGNGVAVVNISGPITKYDSFWARIFGFATTQGIEKAIRQAVESSDVSSVLLVIDSPGGGVPGVNELAETIRQLRRIKPIFAHVDDLAASAGFWIASQAEHITMNSMGEVGSIGVFALAPDSTGLYEQAGIHMNLLTTGPFKGAGAPGVPISEEQLAEFQKRVDQTFQMFRRAVQTGRGMTKADVDAVSDGRVFSSGDALSLNLIDRVRSFDQAVADASRMSSDQARKAKGRIAAAVDVRQALSNATGDI